MTMLLGKPLAQIRASLNMPTLEPGAVVVAAHEAAHAIIVLAHGAGVSELEVHATPTKWDGHCLWENIPPDEYAGEAFAAGAASLDFLSPTVRNGDPWQAAEGDMEPLRRYGIFQQRDLEYYRASAYTVLHANRTALDRLAYALLDHEGHMNADQIRAIVEPGMLPDAQSNPAAWTKAQMRTLANKIERTVQSGFIPAAIRGPLEELKRLHRLENPGAASGSTIPGMRYGDTLAIAPATPGGYETRHLRGAR